MADEISATATDAAPPRKKGSRLRVIMLAAVIVAAIAGGGVWFFAGSKSGDAVEPEQGVDAKHAAPKGPALYVEFDPPFVVNVEARGVIRFLQVSVEVMTRDQATADLIKQHTPMLRNDLLMLLGNQTYEKIGTREGKALLRKEALDAIATVIAGEGGNAKHVEQLYFTSFVMQ